MATVSGSFTAVGSSSLLGLSGREKLEYSITGTFVGTWVIEYDVGGGQAWRELATGAAAASGMIDTTGIYKSVRVRCSAYTSGTLTYSINDTDAVTEVYKAPDGTDAAEHGDSGFNVLRAGGRAVPSTVNISLAASSTTDGIDVTLQVRDARGADVDGVYLLNFWVSEDAQGEGLTADTASGDLTWGTGTELQEIVSKKHYQVQTDVNGAAECTLVDSANPTDQYFCVANPTTGHVIVSAASGTNWQGV